MSVFADYARYYDIIYAEKDYDEEASYTHNLIQRYRSGASKILELGSGTGRHAALLAKMGYAVCGIERSEEMLERARRNCAGDRITFKSGDIKSVRLVERYDAVISLFHVISYQTSNADLSAAFETASRHLDSGGVFIFDFWYGPAVLAIGPTIRRKHVVGDNIEITRVASPVVHPNNNVVDVKYNIHVKNYLNGKTSVIDEVHRMRYLFLPELQYLLEKAGFRAVHTAEWMTGKTAGFDTWSCCMVAERI